MWPPPPHSWEQSATELARRRLPTLSRSRVSLCLSAAVARLRLRPTPPPHSPQSSLPGEQKAPPAPTPPNSSPPPSDPKPPKCPRSICSDGPEFGNSGSRPQAWGLADPPPYTPGPPPGTPRGLPGRSRRQACAYLVGSLRRPLRVRPRSRPSARSEPPSGPPTGRRPPSSPGAAGS